MERTPLSNDNQPKSLYEKVNDAALAKRGAYIEALKNAKSFPELSAALEAYAVSDEDEMNPQMVVISFAEPNSGFSEMVGGENLDKIVAGMVTIATENLKGLNEIRGLVYDASLADKIYEIQNPQSDLQIRTAEEIARGEDILNSIPSRFDV